MARPKKSRNAKNNALTPESLAAAISTAVSQALDPIAQKLDDVINGQQEPVKLDDNALELIGVDTAAELGEILDEAIDAAADALDAAGNPVAAAVVDAGLDTAEVIAEVVKARKGRKAAGEELEPVTAEEVAEVIEAVAEDIAAELTDEELQQLADEGFVDESVLDEAKETAPAAGAKRRGRISGKKSAGNTYTRQTKKAAVPAYQRKYSNLFVSAKESQMQREEKKLPAMVRFARAVKCADYFARGGASGGFADTDRAAWAAEKYYKDAGLARSFKSMSVTEPSSSGILVPQDYLDDVIEMLYDNTVLFELGAQKIPMRHGNLSIARQTSGARAHWGGEGRNIQTSQPTHGQLHLSAKRLQAIVIMTEELMRSTDMSADTIFGNDLIMQMKLGIEYGGLLGNGTEFTPLGLYFNKAVERVNLLTVGDTQIADADGRPSADLPIFIKGKVLAKNVIGVKFGWAFNSEAEQYLKRLKFADGKYVWKDEMDKGLFNGDPYRTTNMIPTAENGTTTMFFGNWSDFLLGEQFGLETRTAYEASVQTDTGVVNTFQSVQTATRATTYVDMGNRHDESFIKVANVKVRG